jgi:hypothetical protein
MTLVTGGFTTYDAKGNREDLTDIIYNISPTDTPFISMAGRGKASAVLHEWQTDALAAASTANAQLEGDDITAGASTATTRVQNYCQISYKALAVTGTQEVVNKAGRDSEVAYQVAKRGNELKRDMEAILTQNQGYNAGASGTARKARSLESWLSTNVSYTTSDGTNASAGTASRTDGTQRAFTEAILKSVIQRVYSSGGVPKIVMVGPVNKQNISAFAGRTNATVYVDQKTLIQGAASLYASDFGDVKIVPNRFQRERSAFVMDPEYVKVSYLRPFKTEDLARTGDSMRKTIITEYTLEMCNEAAHGAAFDLTTSLST